MGFDYATLETLVARHPGWRLLRSEHAPLVASFLHRVFVASNVRAIADTDLVEALEDDLYVLRRQFGNDAFSKSAAAYLDDWADPESGWLRRFHRHGSDEPQFELAPGAVKAIAWLGTLADGGFVGTQVRVLLLIELIEQMSDGAESDPAARIAALRKRREAIDAEIARVSAGDVACLDDTALKDRFQQFMRLSDELLTDFRAVEHELRQSDRRVRERMASSDAAGAGSLDQLLRECREMMHSHTGRSLRAARDVLIAGRRHEALTERLAKVLALPAVAESTPAPRTRRIHYDWLDASEHARRTLVQLSAQLQRAADAQAWREKRRIEEVVDDIESRATALRDSLPAEDMMCIADASAAFVARAKKPRFVAAAAAGVSEPEPGAVQAHFGDVSAPADRIDRDRLSRHIQQALQERAEVTLRELTEAQPLEQGLAELLVYVELAQSEFAARIDEDNTDVIRWEAAIAGDGPPIFKQARLPRIVFVR